MMAHTGLEEFFAAVRENPGSSWTKIRPLIHGNDTDKAELRDRLIRDGQVVNGSAREGQFKLWVSDDPAATRAGLSTAPARDSAPSRERASAESRAAVPYVSRHGTQHGTTDDRGAELLSTPDVLTAVDGSSRPLLGDDAYLPWLYSKLEAGLITEGEWRQASRAHRFVVQRCG